MRFSFFFFPHSLSDSKHSNHTVVVFQTVQFVMYLSCAFDADMSALENWEDFTCFSVECIMASLISIELSCKLMKKSWKASIFNESMSNHELLKLCTDADWSVYFSIS